MEHYPSLLAGYATALLLWLAVWRLRPTFWPEPDRPNFKHPWREIGYVLLAGVAVLAIGQLYVRGIRFPTENAAGPILESLNQLLIFAPIPLLLVIRRHPPETGWIKTNRIGIRLLTGIGFALAALLVYTLVRSGAHDWFTVAANIYTYDNLGFATQVFLEDLTIAVLATRIAAAVGPKATAAAVAVLFAAGHIPTMMAEGAIAAELLPLIADAALGFAVISAGLHSRDIWWLWPVHFTMDMTQFARVTGVGG